MSRSPRALFLTAAGLMLIAESSLSQDWPQWRGAHRDGKAAEFQVPEKWPEDLTQKWKVTVGDGDSTPALVGDRVYVSARQEGKECTLCLDASTGKEIWRDEYEGEPATGPASRHAGPRSSPAVADGKVVTLGVRGVLSCLDAKTGEVVWRKDEFAGEWPRFFTSSSPIIVDGRCIAQLGGAESGGVVGYELDSGQVAWKWTDDGTAYASPVLLVSGDEKLLVALTAEHVVALDTGDGTLAWKAPFAAQRRSYNASTPIVHGQDIIYSGAGRGTTAVRISLEGDAFVAKERWSNPEIAVQYNSPVLANGHVFGITSRGEMFCLSAENGETAWTQPTGDRSGFGSVVEASGALFALTPKAELIVFAPEAEQYRELARYSVAESDVYASPVLSKNRIFIKSQDDLTLWIVP